MQGIKRRIASSLVALPVIAGSLVIGGMAAQAASGGKTVNAVVGKGGACPNVMVIAARGSGEQPQGSAWASPASYAKSGDHYGAGQVNWDVYYSLSKSRGDVSLDPLIYPADAVIPDIYQHAPKYVASSDTGTNALVSEVNRIEQSCGAGRVKYVFTGYSQGAWVIHNALYQLPGIWDRIVGVSFFGDPLYVPGQEIVRDGPPILPPFWGAATLVSGAKTDVPSSIRSVTASYCLTGDPVCQGGLANLSAVATCGAAASHLIAYGMCPHFNYSPKETAKAAAFIAPHMPTSSGTPPKATSIVGDLNADGKVNCTDVNIMKDYFGTVYTSPATAQFPHPNDLNRDGKVDVFDLSILLSHWTGPNDGTC
jgi:Cutinase/Dockerin type I domain